MMIWSKKWPQPVSPSATTGLNWNPDPDVKFRRKCRGGPLLLFLIIFIVRQSNFRASTRHYINAESWKSETEENQMLLHLAHRNILDE